MNHKREPTCITLSWPKKMHTKKSSVYSLSVHTVKRYAWETGFKTLSIYEIVDICCHVIACKITIDTAVQKEACVLKTSAVKCQLIPSMNQHPERRTPHQHLSQQLVKSQPTFDLFILVCWHLADYRPTFDQVLIKCQLRCQSSIDWDVARGNWSRVSSRSTLDRDALR